VPRSACWPGGKELHMSCGGSGFDSQMGSFAVGHSGSKVLHFFSPHFYNWLRKCQYAVVEQNFILKSWPAEKNAIANMQKCSLRASFP
jgi:hypothetical protein